MTSNWSINNQKQYSWTIKNTKEKPHLNRTEVDLFIKCQFLRKSGAKTKKEKEKKRNSKRKRKEKTSKQTKANIEEHKLKMIIRLIITNTYYFSQRINVHNRTYYENFGKSYFMFNLPVKYM